MIIGDLMNNDEKLYLVQDDIEGPLDDEINLTEDEMKHVEELKKKYEIK